MAEVTMDVLRDALRQIAPTIDPKTTTRGMVFARLASLLDVSKDELKKRWKQEIVELITDCLMPEDDGTAETENMVPNTSHHRAQSDEEDDDVAPRKRRTINRSRRVVDAEDDEDDEQEEEPPAAARKRQKIAQRSVKSRVVADDDSEEVDGDDVEEVVESTSSRKKLPSSRKNGRKPSRVSDGSEDSEDSDADASTTRRRRKAPAARRKAPKDAQPHGLVALKEMAQAARLLNPAMHSRLKKAASDEERENILRDVLNEKGITFHGRYPKKSEITAVKRKRDLEAEQDGIDQSAILPEGSRRRTRGATPRYTVDVSDESEGDAVERSDDVNRHIHDDSEEKDESDASSEASFKVGEANSSGDEEEA
ncbi:hypothetical protein P43SY_006428 [Pythium insidiosum]|uniref:Uncharacterized protein n=1 Tax=Pythium insidiosum TaxID=114742 RepID=A0AAD5LSN6_PYTIN|nr:hypothetical protein P43SY_006428 [Pythium insidiosum]